MEEMKLDPRDRLDLCRFRMDILRMAIDGLDRGDLTHPDDALASLGWFANGIAVDMAEAISDMEASKRKASDPQA